MSLKLEYESSDSESAPQADIPENLEIVAQVPEIEDPEDIVYMRRLLVEQELLGNAEIPRNEPTPVDAELQDKIENFTRLKERGILFNDRLGTTHAFKNPAMMNKMISFLQIDQYGSNYSKSEFDPAKFGKQFDYSKLEEAAPMKVNPYLSHTKSAVGASISKAKARGGKNLNSRFQPSKASTRMVI